MKAFVRDIDNLLTKTFHNLLNLISRDTEWIVPLSGGHDSRLIVNYLLKLGVKNVTCFTYGKPGNRQSEISKMVADAAGYKWYFIEYTESKWHNLHQNNIIDSYFNFSFNGVSTPHVMDLLAIYELKQKNIISDKAVFLPGHTSITENGFPQDNSAANLEDAISQLFQKKYKIGIFPHAKINLKQLLSSSIEDSKHLQACFNWREKQTKSIVNSLRVYEFFEFNYALPLLYKDIAKFWLNIPYEYLIDCNTPQKLDHWLSFWGVLQRAP